MRIRLKVKSVKIPFSVISIENSAFSRCSLLDSVEIPPSVLYICDNAFESCYQLKNVYIPSSVTSFGHYVFKDCENLEVVIQNSKDKISFVSNSFKGCKSVTYTN